MRKLLLILFILLATPLLAEEFTVTVEGLVQGQKAKGQGRRGNQQSQESLAGAKIVAQPLPFWGKGSKEELDRFEKANGKLPTLTVAGEGVSNENGKFSFEVTISWDGKEGKIPVVIHKNRDGSQEDRARVDIRLNVSASGYKSNVEKAYVTEKQPCYSNPMLYGDMIVKGKVVLLKDRSPMSGLKLEIVYTENRYNHQTRKNDAPILHRTEFETAADGTFELLNPNDGKGGGLQMVASGYAFMAGSKAWHNRVSSGQSFDYKTIAVVPGGGFKFHAIDLDTGEPVVTNANISDVVSQRNFRLSVSSDKDGNGQLTGMPVGKYLLQIYSRDIWGPANTEFEIEAGEITDLGDLTFESHKELEVFALTPDGGLQTYNARATYIGDNPRVTMRHNGRDAKLTVSGRLTVENSTLKRMHSGEWEVTVDVEGYALAHKVVTIPETTSVTITLVKAAVVKCHIEDDKKARPYSKVYAVRHGTEAYEKRDTYTTDDLENLHYNHSQNPIPTGMTAEYSSGRGFTRLSAGTYLFIGIHRGGIVKADNIELKSGDTVDVSLKVIPSILKITVLFDGKPMPNHEFKLCQGDRISQHELKEPETCTTDENGTYEHAVTNSTKYTVLHEIEYKWFRASASRGYSLSRTFSNRSVNVNIGTDEEFKVDLAGENQQVVRVKFIEKDGQPVTYCKIYQYVPNETERERSYRSNGINGVKVGDEWVFINMSPMKAIVSATITVENKSNSITSGVLDIIKVPDQTFDVPAKLITINVLVKTEPDTNMDSITVMLAPKGQLNPSSFNNDNRFGNRNGRKLSVDGRCQFLCMSAGDYDLAAIQLKKGGEVVNGASISTSVSEDTSLTIVLSSDVGSAKLNISYPNRAINHQLSFATQGLKTKVHFIDSDEEVVEPQLRGGNVVNSSSSTNKLVSIPVGNYKCIVCIAGFLPYVIEDVEIKKGETAKLDVKPEQAGACIVNLKGLVEFKRRVGNQFTYSFEDAEGKELKFFTPEGHILQAGLHRETGRIVAVNLSKEVKQIRVLFDGYEPIVIKIDIELGRTLQMEYTCKVKAD